MEVFEAILAHSFLLDQVFELLGEDLVLLFLIVHLVQYWGVQKAKYCHVRRVGSWRWR